MPRHLAVAAAVTAAGLAAGSGRAGAQPDDTRELALHERPVDVAPADLRLTWRTDAVLAARATSGAGDAGGDSTTATASAAAEVAVSHEGCDVLVAGGQVDARTGAASPLAFQQWGSLCPISGVLEVELGHRLSWDVQPRLLAPPRMRPGLTRQETINFRTIMLRTQINRPDPLSSLPPPPPLRMLYGGMDFDFTIGWQTGDSPLDFDVRTGGRMIGFERERADGGDPLQVWLFAMEGRMLVHESADHMESQSAMAARADLIQVRNARVGGVQVDADLGVGMGAVTPDDAGRPGADVLTGVGHVAVERAVGPPERAATLSLAAGREHWPLWDGRLVIDDRVTVALTVARRRMRVRVEGSMGRVHLIASEPRLTSATTGGATTIVDYDLGRHVTLRGRTEAGWSVYAPGASPEAPRPAVESLVSAVVHLGNR